MAHTTLPRVTIGVDTHKDLHVAAARDQLGRRLATTMAPAMAPATRAGYAQLLTWAHGLGEPVAWGVEGTGSYGAGLARFLAAHRQRVLEVNRPDRQARRRRGKSDPVDADAAARTVQAGEATGVPKAQDGVVEMARALRVARQTAVKARTQAINAIKALLVTAPSELREQLAGLPTTRLLRQAASLDPRTAGHPDRGHDAGPGWPGAALPAPGRRDHPAGRQARPAHHHRHPQAAPAAGRRPRQRRRAARSPPATTPGGCAQRPRSPRCAAAPRWRPPPARPSATGSTAVVTARPMRRCTGS
jgi:Transposase